MATKRERDLAKHMEISIEQIGILREMRGLSEDSIEKLPEKALKSSFRRLDFPDMPRQREAFRLSQAGLQSQYEGHSALCRALEQLDSMRLRISPGRRAGLPTGGAVAPGATAMLPPPPAAGLAPRRWQSIGPGNIGGRTRAILPHPIQTDTLWLGSAGGGVWRTDDAGLTWEPVDDFMGNLAVTSLVMDPSDVNVIYAGTGEGFGNSDAIRGAGVFVTRDGVNWSQLGSTSGPEFRRTNRVAMTSDGSVLFAATNDGVFQSVDPARATWTKVLDVGAADMKCHPTDPQKAVVGSLSGGNVWSTVDAGANWRLATHSGVWNGRVELCYAEADSDIVYASINIGNGQVWRSQNGGRSFSKRKSRNGSNQASNYLGDQGWYDNVIWAGDPNDSDFVIVGGIDLWRSTDGGDTLIEMSTWWDPDSAHADHHAIVAHSGFDGNANKSVFFGNDGGIFRTDDVTSAGNEPAPPKVTGWTGLNNGYGVTQFYGGAVQSATGVIVCGAQDNGTLAYHPANGANGWQTVFGGDGGFCASDPSDPQVFYGEYVYLNIHRNTDGATSDDLAGDRYISGQFWNPVARIWDWKPAPFRIPDAFNQRALFIAPFALDHANPDTILAGGESLWRTADAKAPNTLASGPRWMRIKAPSNRNISAVTIDAVDSDHVWVGHTDGEIWRCTNATAASPTWTQIDQQPVAQPLSVSRYCHQITVSPFDSDRVVVAFGEFARSNVWLTQDRGAAWTDIGASLPEAPIRAVTFHPTRSTWLYIGTEVGVFGSEDLGLTWSPVNEGPANVSVDDLIWSDETMICITHGRGVFTIDLSNAALTG